MSQEIPLRLLNKRVDITRLVESSAGVGKFTKAATVIASNVPMRLSSQMGGAARVTEAIEGRQHIAMQHLAAYFAPTQDVKKDDTFVLDGRTYRVMSTVKTSVDFYLKASVEEIQTS